MDEPCHKLLARAGLPRDQHIAVGRSSRGDEDPGLARRGAAPYHLRRIDRAGVRNGACPEATARDRHQLIRITWPSEVVADSGPEGRDGEGLRTLGGD